MATPTTRAKHSTTDARASNAFVLEGLVLLDENGHKVIFNLFADGTWDVTSDAQPFLEVAEPSAQGEDEGAVGNKWLIIPTARIHKDSFSCDMFEPGTPEAPFFVSSLDKL